MERRLAAILAANVVGYSRLVRVEEEGTIAALKTLRADLVDPKIAAPHDRFGSFPEVLHWSPRTPFHLQHRTFRADFAENVWTALNSGRFLVGRSTGKICQ